MKRGFEIIATTAIAMVFIFCSTGLRGQGAALQVKLVFIYNFTRYIEWPQKEGDFIIGVYGNDQEIFNAFLDLASKKVSSKRIVVKTFTTISEAANCDILFIPAKSSNHLADVAVGLKNTLIITEKPGMAQKGSGINFIEVDGKVRFEINKSEIEKAGLKVSSQLMGLAIEV